MNVPLLLQFVLMIAAALIYKQDRGFDRHTQDVAKLNMTAEKHLMIISNSKLLNKSKQFLDFITQCIC